MNTLLYEKVSAAGLRIQHACEVGVYLPETSNVRGWIGAGVRTTLVEANPEIASQCRAVYGHHDHVTISALAVTDVPGTLRLYRAGASTFAAGLPASPAMVNDGYVPNDADAIDVPAVTFDTIDDGSIDLLSVDVEGGEWYVLRHMRSRPAVLSIETGRGRYRNPFMGEILDWMGHNGYIRWYRKGADTVYVRNGVVRPTLRERLMRLH